MPKSPETAQKPLHFEIHGGKKLHGSIDINTSKNGAVFLLCASLLNRGTTTLRRMPKIEEVYRIIEVLESIGVSVTWRKNDVRITPPTARSTDGRTKLKKLSVSRINKESAVRTRSILMFISPLVHALRTFSLPQSGGCKLGERTVRPHFYALENFGISIDATSDSYKVSSKKLTPAEIVMYESGDTATGNAIMAAALIPGTTTIKYASANYQIQELCFFLEDAGVRIDGIGTTTLTVHGVESIDTSLDYTLAEDPTDAMFFLASAIVTKSAVTLNRCPIEFLELELLVLKKMGLKYTQSEPYASQNGRTKLVDITTAPSHLTAPLDKVHARPYPGLNMDNLPFFAVIATQAEGSTLIHDWMYEKRALYFTELDKLGADTMLADPHRIFINGPTKLRAAELVCPPALRPAAIILIAMLAARGRSILRDVYTIERGYEDLANRLQLLGADVNVMR